MAEAKERRERTMQSIKLIAPFDGDKNYLALYVDSLNALMPASSSLTEEEKPFYFQCVVSTLRGPALNVVRREQPTSWEILRRLLVDEFADPTPVTTLILLINNIKYRGSVKQLCEEINAENCKIKDSLKLRETNISVVNFLIGELQQMSLKTLKRELPLHLVALINANMVTDIKSAIQVLKENDVYNNVVIEKFSKSKQNLSQPRQQFNSFRNSSSYPTSAYNNNFTDMQQHHPYINNFKTVQQTPFYNTCFNNNPQNQYYDAQYNNNRNLCNNPIMNSQPIHNTKGNSSNQSRIRRFGNPEPMEQDNENFRLEASDTYQK